MSDNGELEDKPPAPPVRMSSTIFSSGGKDPLSANHSLKPLPSVPEERKPRNKIISIFSSTEKGIMLQLFDCIILFHWSFITSLCFWEV